MTPAKATATDTGTPLVPLSCAHPVQRVQRPGLLLTRAGTEDCCEFDFTLHPLPDENLAAILMRLKSLLNEFKAVPVLQFSFGSLDSLRECNQAMDRCFGEDSWPVTWVGIPGTTDGKLGGFQVFAVSSREIKRVRREGRVIGSIFNNGGSRYCLFGGLGYSRPNLSRTEQTRQTLEDLEGLLCSNGFTMGEVIRTWFYLEEILTWYGEFNQVRTTFYNRHQFRVGSLPASTGISAPNPFGSALSLAVWAVQPLQGSVFPVREILSPLQCPAAAYGSSFSRAVEMDLPGGARRLVVSGTASIEPGGKTVWVGDIARQVDLTMDVIRAMLATRGMSFDDTSRATAYCKDPAYATVFAQWWASHCRSSSASLPVHCDICRDDLLFELELDVVSR